MLIPGKPASEEMLIANDRLYLSIKDSYFVSDAELDAANIVQDYWSRRTGYVLWMHDGQNTQFVRSGWYPGDMTAIGDNQARVKVPIGTRIDNRFIELKPEHVLSLDPLPGVRDHDNFMGTKRPQLQWGGPYESESYGIRISDARSGKVLIERNDLRESRFTPDIDLPYGSYKYTVWSNGANGKRIYESQEYCMYLAPPPMEILEGLGNTFSTNPTIKWSEAELAEAYSVGLSK